MKLQHFREVVTIAERGSIRAAARQLSIAQPALTRSLAGLERELGAPLFERHAHGVVATRHGEAFIRRAISILQEVRRAREECEQIGGATTGTVTIGLSIAAHLSLLPAILRPFRERYPGIRMHIIEGFYPTLEAGLREGSIDFYAGPESGGKELPGLSKEVLTPGRRTILGRVGHPLAGATSLAQLCQADWVTTSITTDAADELGMLFARHELQPPKLAVRSQSALTLMTCLTHSDLLAMVPSQWTGFELTAKALRAINVVEELTAPAIVVIRRQDLPLTPAASYLLDLVLRAQARLKSPP